MFLPIPYAIALFFIIWFVVLFAVLPFGVESQQEAGDFVMGTDPGAPATLRLWPKILWTTGIAVVVFGILMGVATFMG